MVNVKDVFKKVSVPRPQISTRVAYSTTPKQRRNYLEDISKARGKAMEYNKYINQQRSEYIKNQEEFQRRLSNIKKATQQYESSRADISREVESLRRYEASLQAQQDRLAAQKSSSRSRSSRSRSRNFVFKDSKDIESGSQVYNKKNNTYTFFKGTPITVQNEIVKKVESYKAPADNKRLMSYVKNYNNPPLTRTPKPVFGKSTVFDSLFNLFK